MQTAPTQTIFDVITDFLTAEPTPQSVLAYRLPPELETRALDLLARKREKALSLDEESEMLDFIRADDMMTLLKAKTHINTQRVL